MKDQHLQDITPETLFSDRTLWQAWLDVEAALARAQAEIGMIPAWAAEEIARHARIEAIGEDRLRASIALTMAPILSLTRCLAEDAGEAGRYVHWGATTQNVMQTGRLLLIRRARAGIDDALAQAFGRLADLAREHAETPMAGRTNRRHAVPITFGFKVAGWIDELSRAVDRLDDAGARTFRLPFGGAVGAFHGYGEDGPALMAALANELDLGELLVPGRTVNDLFIELVMQLGMFGMTTERIAREAYVLMTEEIGELSERLEVGVVGSSTMPHKVNPKHVVRLQAECARLRAQTAPALEAGLPSHEGDAAANHLLSSVLDTALPLGWTVARDLARFLDRLETHPVRMRENLTRSGGLVATERLMMALAPVTGRSRAHDLVHHAVEYVAESGAELETTLLTVPEVRALGAAEVRTLLDPAGYTGQSAGIAHRLADVAEKRAAALRG
ncbi:lyase family protein [Allosediminivita pacifica]|uniref:3-carboxy-cis,cis-muconate cycloisomerase n=1 Tax=Allosediminivita pacifica TaxID=1267769 RepID=A0A2T6ANT6_9RHOB|nr:lyase family protein [Allosediminivita pacifica]PTX45484.1 3-carboxy-cis,cis-muconate cycloisomerase [Allosediminivita pacifica]GGB19829.1 adenylosuccinate lyase [Allosediminivita pacifica]